MSHPPRPLHYTVGQEVLFISTTLRSRATVRAQMPDYNWDYEVEFEDGARTWAMGYELSPLPALIQLAEQAE